MEGFNAGVVAGVVCHGDQPVIVLRLPRFGLLRLDDANQACRHQATGEGGRVHQHEDVEWVAVPTQRGGQEAEVEGERREFGQAAVLPEQPQAVIGHVTERNSRH